MTEMEFAYLLEGYNKIQARNSLRMLEASSYPYAKDEKRKEIHKKHYENALTEERKLSKIITTKDLINLGFERASNGR